MLSFLKNNKISQHDPHDRKSKINPQDNQPDNEKNVCDTYQHINMNKRSLMRKNLNSIIVMRYISPPFNEYAKPPYIS